MFQTTSTTASTGSKAANDGWDVEEDEWAPLEEAKPVNTATEKAPASPLSTDFVPVTSDKGVKSISAYQWDAPVKSSSSSQVISVF